MPTFDPSQEEESEFTPWPEGDYDFTVAEATDKTSKTSGNQMIEVKLKLMRPDGASRNVLDWLLFTPKMMWKNRHAHEAVGAAAVWRSGYTDASKLLGRSGRLALQIKDDKDKDGRPIKRNQVKDYLVPPSQPQQPAPAPPPLQAAPEQANPPMQADGTLNEMPSEQDPDVPF